MLAVVFVEFEDRDGPATWSAPSWSASATAAAASASRGATFTLNTYQWLLPGMQAEAAATFQRLLANPEPDEDDEHAANDGA